MDARAGVGTRIACECFPGHSRLSKHGVVDYNRRTYLSPEKHTSLSVYFRLLHFRAAHRCSPRGFNRVPQEGSCMLGDRRRHLPRTQGGRPVSLARKTLVLGGGVLAGHVTRPGPDPSVDNASTRLGASRPVADLIASDCVSRPCFPEGKTGSSNICLPICLPFLMTGTADNSIQLCVTPRNAFIGSGCWLASGEASGSYAASIASELGTYVQTHPRCHGARATCRLLVEPASLSIHIATAVRAWPIFCSSLSPLDGTQSDFRRQPPEKNA